MTTYGNVQYAREVHERLVAHQLDATATPLTCGYTWDCDEPLTPLINGETVWLACPRCHAALTNIPKMFWYSKTPAQYAIAPM
jgi:hypothetical protein